MGLGVTVNNNESGQKLEYAGECRDWRLFAEPRAAYRPSDSSVVAQLMSWPPPIFILIIPNSKLEGGVASPNTPNR